MKFGHYVAEIFSYDRTELKFVSALSKEFDLTKENSFQTITFLANKMKYAPVTVGFNQAVPGTTTITLVGEDGQSQVFQLKHMVNILMVRKWLLVNIKFL